MSKITTPAIERVKQKNKTASGQRKQYSYSRDAWLRLKRNPTAIFGMCVIILLILVAIFADVIAPYDPLEVKVSRAQQTPSVNHWFGTDELGRDIFSRCIVGARYSLPIGIFCSLVGLIIGGALGLVSAFFGGKTDVIVQRFVDIMQAIPGLLLSVMIVATLGNGTPQLLTALIIGGLPGIIRMTRAAIFTVRESEYLDSSVSIGAGNLRLMFRHALPNAVGHVIVFAVGSVAQTIVVISGMSYIGIGIQPPTPEWGVMLSNARSYLASLPHMVFFPGLMIMITVLGLNLFGDGLRDALDPRLK